MVCCSKAFLVSRNVQHFSPLCGKPPEDTSVKLLDCQPDQGGFWSAVRRSGSRLGAGISWSEEWLCVSSQYSNEAVNLDGIKLSHFCSMGFMCLLLWQCDHPFERSTLETPVDYGWLKKNLKTLKLRTVRKALSHSDTLLVVSCHSHANNLICIWIWILVVSKSN